VYNEEVKNRFLSTIENKNTAMFYKTVLEKTQIMEQMYKKDLYKFNTKKEIMDLLASLGCSTLKSVTTMFSPITIYFKWAISEGYVSATYYGILKSITKEDLRSVVSKIKFKQKIINRNELYHIAENICYNKQDAVVFILLFEGIDGKEHEDILNLKVNNCDFSKNIITVVSDESARLVSIPERSMKIIKAATEEKEYYKVNGEAENCKSPFTIIENSEYVLRKGGKSNFNNKINSLTVNSRITRMKKYTDKLFLTPMSIFQSGLIDKCKEMESEKEILTPEDYQGIYKINNLNPNGWFNLKDLYEEYKKIIS